MLQVGFQFMSNLSKIDWVFLDYVAFGGYSLQELLGFQARLANWIFSYYQEHLLEGSTYLDS